MLSQNGKVAEYRNHIIKYPRSVAVNHAGLWIRRHQFESGRGYPFPFNRISFISSCRRTVNDEKHQCTIPYLRFNTCRSSYNWHGRTDGN